MKFKWAADGSDRWTLGARDYTCALYCTVTYVDARYRMQLYNCGSGKQNSLLKTQTFDTLHEARAMGSVLYELEHPYYPLTLTGRP